MKTLYQTICSEDKVNENIVDDFLTNNELFTTLKEKSKQILVNSNKQIVISILNIFYVIVDKNVPLKEKMAAIACLVYVISPMDAISDFLPAGYTDDIAMITYTINFLKRYITSDIKKKSEEKFNEWFNK